MYNSRLQEFHLMVAGIDDLDQREPFCDLMQAVAEGKFKKPVTLIVLFLMINFDVLEWRYNIH